jgi:hypothetical protein
MIICNNILKQWYNVLYIIYNFVEKEIRLSKIKEIVQGQIASDSQDVTQTVWLENWLIS